MPQSGFSCYLVLALSTGHPSGWLYESETDANNERNVCEELSHIFLVSLQFVVYDLTQIYTPGGHNEPGANANQSLT